MLVRRPGGEWHEPEEGAYPSEADLQKMTARSPSLLLAEHLIHLTWADRDITGNLRLSEQRS